MTAPVLLGRVVRLQVQRSPIKTGDRGRREYRPEVITRVASLELSEGGAVGVTADGERILDVHHTDHPQTRNPRGRSGLSVMALPDYVALRERFGPHLADGIAGESVLIDGDALAFRDLDAGLVLETADGPVVVGSVEVADPCVEFTRFCLGRSSDSPVDAVVRSTLLELGDGRRGFRGVPDVGVLREGDRVHLRY